VDIGASQAVVFALVADGMLSLPRILRAAFKHPWVASYQIGFGPPLVRATPELASAVREARSALDKLDIYLDRCILDETERTRLATLQRRLLVRRKGPVEAEDLTIASAQSLDLLVRLNVPATAPDAVRDSMVDAGIPIDYVPSNTAPEPLTGRFLVRLHDPRNARLFHLESVAAKSVGDEGLALELWTPVDYRKIWSAWLTVLAYVAPFEMVEIGAPTAHARVSRDGERS